MKKAISLLSILVVTNLPVSCGLFGCGPFDERPIKIVSISAKIGSMSERIFEEEVSADFKIATIRAKVDKTVRVGQIKKTIFSFSNVAYACSPPPPPVQQLNSINITSEKPLFFNDIEYKSGENLNLLFKILHFEEEISIEEFNEFPDSYYLLSGYGDDNILFQLKSKPDTPVSQKFTFIFTFGDGLEYQVLTPVFTVD